MKTEDRIDTALHGHDPVPALRSLVQVFSREGKSKTEIYDLLETYLVQLRSRTEYSEVAEEAVLDVMDAVSGWCHSDAELLPDKPVR